jgi:potassium channel subfamily K protein 9
LILGYGHSTPKTDGGKLFTMVYAMIGIPLGLVMFNSIGERLNNFSSIVINKLRKTVKARQAETTEMDLIFVVSTLSAIVATTGAAVFSHYEGWSYFHAIYFCFATLTTIGFGDFVALQQDNSLETKPEYVTFALFFIMFGLAIIAASLNLMVLKFMTMNTEDERRDEQQAIQVL